MSTKKLFDAKKVKAIYRTRFDIFHLANFVAFIGGDPVFEWIPICGVYRNRKRRPYYRRWNNLVPLCDVPHDLIICGRCDAMLQARKWDIKDLDQYSY